MTRYLPDTNIVSLLVRENATLDRKLIEAKASGAVFVLCPVVIYEVERGLKRIGAPRLIAKYKRLTSGWEYLDFTRQAWLKASELWSFSRDQGMPLPDADILIAAHAITLDATLITANERHFRLFEPLGLRLENWTQP